MTQINAEKSVVYAVEVIVPAVVTNKAVVYAVEVIVPAVVTNKAVVYAVEMVPLFAEVEKVNLYGVETTYPDGNAHQDTLAERPVYKVGPEPYVSFGPGTELRVNLFHATDYVVFYLKPDAVTVEEVSVTIPAGEISLSIDEDFNQAMIVKSEYLTPALRRAVAATLRFRVPVVL